jgi:hypothetical protein
MYSIHTLKITKPYQKSLFQIRHPENAQAIIGFYSNCNLGFPTNQPYRGEKVGSVTLAISDGGDMVYGSLIAFDTVEQLDFFSKQVLPSSLQFNATKKNKITYEPTNIKISDALIEGYYEDYFPQVFNLSPTAPPTGGGGVIINGNDAGGGINNETRPSDDPTNTTPVFRPYLVNIYVQYKPKPTSSKV